MKKLLLSVAALGCFVSAHAQWATSGTSIYNTNTGNVGVRISSPAAPFQIFDGGTNIHTGIKFYPGSGPAENAVVQTLKQGYKGIFYSVANDDGGQGQAAVFLKSGPSSKVSLLSSVFEIRTGVPYAGAIAETSGTSALYINDLQQVGIGTTAPGSFKLAVEGKIGAREINVTATNPFPDYVFENNYQLRSLPEVEKYVQQHKHLPEIPSAAQVEKDGINVGEMNALLLKKIEELTLYVIEQNKRIDSLEAQNQVLEKSNK
jgi:hypothetical protein